MYFPRTKADKDKMARSAVPPIRGVKLACGHSTEGPPTVSNPDRWWCCGGYRKKKR